MRKLVCHVVLLSATLTCLQALTTPGFKGFAGFLGSFSVRPNNYYLLDTDDYSTSEKIQKTFEDPMLSAQGYFGGQLQFQDTLILRGEFSVDAPDIWGKSLFEKPARKNSTFQIQEASAVCKLQSDPLTHYLSLFYGEYEPIGSDVFLQRQFGIAPIRSDLTSSFNSVNGIAIDESYGGGISYIARSSNLERPLAAGFYLYRERKDWEWKDLYWREKNDFWEDLYWTRSRTTRTPNGVTGADFRIGGAFDYLTFDLRAGISLHDDDGAILGRDFVGFKAGLSLLAGKPTSVFNIFLQTGFTDLIMDPQHLISDDTVYKKLAADSFYFLFEPRINLRQAKFSVTAFNIPYSQASKMFFLNNYNSGRKELQTYSWQRRVNPCGIDFHASTNLIHLGETTLTTGMHVTLSMGGQTLHEMYREKEEERNSDNPWKKTVFISPYAKLPVHGGEVYAAASISSHIFSQEDNWPSCVSVKVGFKINF